MSELMDQERRITRCYLVEDQTMLRQVLALVFEGEKSLELVGQSENLALALEQCPIIKPDIVIIDAVLPDGKGSTLVQKLSETLPETRFLAISGHQRAELVQEMIRAGVDGFVLKSSPWQVFLEAVLAVAAGENFFCPASKALLDDIASGKETSISSNVLTPREEEFLKHYASGRSTKDISTLLGISSKTSNNHLTNIKNKLRIYEASSLVHYAIRIGLISPP